MSVVAQSPLTLATPPMSLSAVTSLAQVQQSALNSQIATAVASKQLDAYEQQGQAVVKLLEAAANLSKAIGAGQKFDAVA